MINELSDQYLFLNPCINDHSFQISKFKLGQLAYILETETTEIKSSLNIFIVTIMMSTKFVILNTK